MAKMTQSDMMARAEQALQAPARLDSPQSPFVGAKRIMAIAYPIVEGVTFKGALGFPNYCIGDNGTVWSRLRQGVRILGSNQGWAILKEEVDMNGYSAVTLRRDGRAFKRKISRLVLEAFIGIKPDGMEACHFPDITRTNSGLSNLRWDTRIANRRDQEFHGTKAVGSKNGTSKLVECDIPMIRALRARGWSQQRIADRFGVYQTVISKILLGRIWKHV